MVAVAHPQSLVGTCVAMCPVITLRQLQCTLINNCIALCAQTASWPGVWGPNSYPQQPQNGRSQTPESAREALKFVFSAEGAFFRDFIMDELVRSIDAMSRSVSMCVMHNCPCKCCSPPPPPGARSSMCVVHCCYSKCCLPIHVLLPPMLNVLEGAFPEHYLM